MTTRHDDECLQSDDGLDIDTLLGKVDALQKANKDLKKTRDALKKDKHNLQQIKEDLKKQTEYLSGKITTLEMKNKGLQDTIDNVWTEMAAYSIIRCYPRTESIVRTKRGSTNRGIISLVCEVN
jgi:chromosome segregation ATPase